MRIGLYGGSFNPIHNGHIALGTTMLSAMSLDEVWYLVSPLNPWKSKDSDLIDENIRLRLTNLALQDYPNLIASDYEFHLPKPNYTWKTLQQLKAEFPLHEFVIIIGGDNMERFHRWANYEYILKNFSIAVFPRQGTNVNAEIKKFKDSGNDITLVDVPKVNITSTMIRTMIKNREDISPYVPKNIIHEIRRYYHKP